jgi:hypothetical protein
MQYYLVTEHYLEDVFFLHLILLLVCVDGVEEEEGVRRVADRVHVTRHLCTPYTILEGTRHPPPMYTLYNP